MADNFFKSHDVTIEDQRRYARWIANGEEDQAVRHFIEKYINPFIDNYDEKMSEFMIAARSGQLMADERNNMFFEIAAISTALATLMSSNFKTFATIQGSIQLASIESSRVRNEILRTTLDNFDRLTKDAMNRTAENILSNVREVQRAFIVENQRLRKMGFVGDQLAKEIERFKREIKNRFPDYLELERNQNFLKTRATASGVVRNLKLEHYAEMSISTTLLNVDRDGVETESRIEGDIVVEYYERDDRKLKTEARKICNTILKNKINGKSLLALTEDVAKQLGIMTVSEAKATKDYAMGPYCRHSIRRLPASFQDEIRAMINSEAA